MSLPAVALPTTPPPTDGAAVVAEIMAAATADTQGNGCCEQGIGLVQLKPGRDALAQAIHNHYGAHVNLTLDGRAWPTADTSTPQACTAFRFITGREIAGVSATITVEAPKVRLGTEVRGSLVVVNHSKSAVQVSYGGQGVNGFLFDNHGRMAGFLDGPQTSDLRLVTVGPGEVSQPLPLVAGVASCTPATGSAVQPGTYLLKAQLRVGTRDTITTKPVLVTVSRP